MILLTGATGNTGSFVLEWLLSNYPDEQIVCTARAKKSPNHHKITHVEADLSDNVQVIHLFEQYSFHLIIHIANIRYSPIIMSQAEKYAVNQVILVHTTGVYSSFKSYSGLYKEIEQGLLQTLYLRTSYTILRPTMIYGNLRDHNMHKLIKYIANNRLFPIFGGGTTWMQPVHVEDLAKGIVACIDNKTVKNQAYDLSGGTVLTYKELLKMIIGLLDRKVFLIHIPMAAAVNLAAIYGRLSRLISRKPLISVEQVRRLTENKAYPHEKAKLDLGFNPRSFITGISAEIAELRKAGVIR